MLENVIEININDIKITTQYENSKTLNSTQWWLKQSP